jgi:hypothetical protein
MAIVIGKISILGIYLYLQSSLVIYIGQRFVNFKEI